MRPRKGGISVVMVQSLGLLAREDVDALEIAEEEARVEKVVIECLDFWVDGELVKDSGLVDEVVNTPCLETLKVVTAAVACRTAGLGRSAQALDFADGFVDLCVGECVFDDYKTILYDLIDERLCLLVDRLAGEFSRGSCVAVDDAVIRRFRWLIRHCVS